MCVPATRAAVLTETGRDRVETGVGGSLAANPGMLENLLGSETLLGINHKQFADEVLGRVRHS